MHGHEVFDSTDWLEVSKALVLQILIPMFPPHTQNDSGCAFSLPPLLTVTMSPIGVLNENARTHFNTRFKEASAHVRQAKQHALLVWRVLDVALRNHLWNAAELGESSVGETAVEALVRDAFLARVGIVR